MSGCGRAWTGPIVVMDSGDSGDVGALRFAAFAAGVRGVDLVVVSTVPPHGDEVVVVPADLMQGADGYGAEQRGARRPWSARTAFAAARLCARPSAVHVEHAVGPVGDDLVDRATSASLVVLGAHHDVATVASEPTLVARITGVGCPVAVVPQDWTEPQTARPVAVGVDGTEAAWAATVLAAREAQSRGVRLVVFHAWPHDDLVSVIEGQRSGPLSRLRAAEHAIASGQAERLRRICPGLDVTAVEISGSPGAALRNLAGRVDVLVIGRGSHLGLPRWAAVLRMGHFRADLGCPLIIAPDRLR